MNAPLPFSAIVHDGGFSTAQVARLIGRGPAEVATWMRGANPVLLADYEPLHGRLVISFEALVEARAIAHFLDEGVTLPRLRQIMAELRRSTRSRHPLARDRKFVTEGFRIFEADGDRLINIVNECYASPVLMKPALKGHVVFEHGRAAYLQPDPDAFPLVRIDPRHAFGKPVIFERGHAVTTSAAAATAEDEGEAEAAAWFGLSRTAVKQALDFEQLHA